MATRTASRALCAKVPHRSFLSVTGTNTAQLLNGLVTTTVPWPPAAGFYSAFLTAAGKVLYDVFLWPFRDGQQEGYLIEYDPRSAETQPLAQMLKKHVLRSRVRVRDVASEWDVWAAWGKDYSEPQRQWRFGSQGAVEPVWERGISTWAGKDVHRIRDLRAVGMGHRILTPKDALPDEANSHENGTADDYALHRILRGVPEGAFELSGTIPFNSNLDLMGGIDFRKGCYVGQELTVRTYHTGVVRRRVYPVQIYREGQSPREAEVPDESVPTIESTSMTIINPKKSGTVERGTRPKLLGSMHGVGLAVLRTAQLGDLESGNLSMHLDGPNGVRYNIRPWIPSWWPDLTISDDGGS